MHLTMWVHGDGSFPDLNTESNCDARGLDEDNHRGLAEDDGDAKMDHAVKIDLKALELLADMEDDLSLNVDDVLGGVDP